MGGWNDGWQKDGGGWDALTPVRGTYNAVTAGARYTDKYTKTGDDVTDLYTFGGATRRKRRTQERRDKAAAATAYRQAQEAKEAERYNALLAVAQKREEREAQAQAIFQKNLKSLNEYRGPTMAEVEAEPDFMFGLKTGRDTLEGGAAARKGLLGGKSQRAIEKFGQDYGRSKWQDAYQRKYRQLSDMVGVGERSSGRLDAGDASTQGLMSNLYGQGQQSGQHWNDILLGNMGGAGGNVDAQTIAMYKMIGEGAFKGIGAYATGGASLAMPAPQSQEDQPTYLL